MKKLLFLMMTLGVIMTACKKDEGPKASLDGNQWITEEFEAAGDMPAGKFLYDFGAKSGAGKMTAVLIVAKSNSEFNEGDLILMYKGSYTYDASTGKLHVDGDESVVEFITNTKVKIEVDGVQLIFSLVEGKQYPVKDATEFEPAPEEELEITPSIDADWAGGSITFTPNRTIKSWTINYVLPEGLTESELCRTNINLDGELTLGLYLDTEGNIADCEIQIKAADESGNETTCNVTSKAWRPAVYTRRFITAIRDHQYTEVSSTGNLYRQSEYWLGAVSSEGDIVYRFDDKSFDGISYTVPTWATLIDQPEDDKVCYETSASNDVGTLNYEYGELKYELPFNVTE